MDWTLLIFVMNFATGDITETQVTGFQTEAACEASQYNGGPMSDLARFVGASSQNGVEMRLWSDCVGMGYRKPDPILYMEVNDKHKRDRDD